MGFVAFYALLNEAPNAPVLLTEDFMITPRTRAIVSLAAALTTTLALGGCVRPQPFTALDESIPMQDARVRTVRFDNSANQHAHVYLVTDERQWLLGRVEAGARATLRIPDAALTGSTSRVRLAVLTGERVTPQVTRDPRTTLTIEQPASALVSHQWTLTQGQITPMAGTGTRVP